MINPDQNQKFFSIGEAARLLGLSIESLRRWDRAGKIKVGRTPGGKRVFTQEGIDFIRISLNQDSNQPQDLELSKPKQTYTEEEPSEEPTQTVIRIVLPSIPKVNFNFTKIAILSVFLLLVVSNILFFSSSPYPKVLGEKVSVAKGQAVLGVESFIAPVLEEGGLVESFLSPIGRMFSGVGTFIGGRVSLLAISLINNNQSIDTPIDLSIKGKGTFAKDIEGLGNLRIKGTATVGKLITGIVDPYLIENDGNVQSTLSIRSVGDISLSPGSGTVDIQGSSLANVNNISLTGSISGGNITTTNNLTVGGTINNNTLNSTTLVFSGTSPSIYPSTANTPISLEAGTSGAINIGSSSTGDINLGGGSGSTGCTVTNSNGSFTCSSNITSGGNLTANGGYLTTNQTTAYLFNDAATTINLGAAATAVNIGASTGTTTIENGLTVTGATTLSSALSVTGATTLTGNLTLNGTGTFNSTTTFNGRPTFTKAPSLAHTGAWSIGSTNWNISDASVYINPASIGAADNNLFGIAVGGSVKFAVDSEGDTYVNNLILAGSITSATTTIAGDLGVEGNTTLGDATTDTLTVNPATLTWAGGDKTIDITGAATRTLTILNSTSAQVTDLNLSDGSLKTNGTTRLDNNGNLSNIGTLSMSGQLTSTLAPGTAPFVVTSTTNVANLNASSLNGATFAAPGTIGGGTPAGATFTTVSASTSIATTGSGTITSAGLLTASNGLTLTTGALSLTGTSGNIGLTGFGTTAITSTTVSGDVIAATDTSLNTASANLSNFTFKNNNTAAAGLAVNGVTITEQSAAAPLSGTNTSNLLNLAAAANGTVNGINISSATGFTNFLKTPTAVLDSSGNLSGVVTLTATTLAGSLSTASQTNITAVGTLGSLAVTGNINSASGALQTNGVTRIDNSGNFTAVTGSFGGNINPSLDDTYDLGTSSLRWKNAFFSGDVNVGDTVFKNKFRLTEHGNTGIDMLNPKGEVIASWDEDGNFWVKGEIKHGF